MHIQGIESSSSASLNPFLTENDSIEPTLHKNQQTGPISVDTQVNTINSVRDVTIKVSETQPSHHASQLITEQKTNVKKDDLKTVRMWFA